MTLQWSVKANDPLGLIKIFKDVSQDVPITLEELEREYCRLARRSYPLDGIVFVRSWSLFRVSILILLKNQFIKRQI